MSNKAEEYQQDYTSMLKGYDIKPEDIVESLKFLVEEMIETIKELEEKIDGELKQ